MEEEKKYFLAFDIGTTGGRFILWIFSDGHFEMRELTRFPNSMMEFRRKFYWDIFGLYKSLSEDLRECAWHTGYCRTIGSNWLGKRPLGNTKNSG